MSDCLAVAGRDRRSGAFGTFKIEIEDVNNGTGFGEDLGDGSANSTSSASYRSGLTPEAQAMQFHRTSLTRFLFNWNGRKVLCAERRRKGLRTTKQSAERHKTTTEVSCIVEPKLACLANYL
jgi:hypothetical protein